VTLAFSSCRVCARQPEWSKRRHFNATGCGIALRTTRRFAFRPSEPAAAPFSDPTAVIGADDILSGINFDAERLFNLAVGGQKCSSSSQLIE